MKFKQWNARPKHYPNTGYKPLHHSNQVPEAVHRYNSSSPFVPVAVKPMKYTMELRRAPLNLLILLIITIDVGESKRPRRDI